MSYLPYVIGAYAVFVLVFLWDFLAPRLQLIQQACPLWVPLVEAGETEGAGADCFIIWYVVRVWLFCPSLSCSCCC